MRGRFRRGVLRLCLLGVLAAGAMLMLLVGSGAAADPSAGCTTSAGVTTCVFAYTGAVQSWTVPTGVTSATFDVSGAQGATGSSGSAFGPGGLGGDATATMSVTPGQTFQLNVGGAGSGTTGGVNGGGAGAVSGDFFGGGGGGASDVRQGTFGLDDRLLVAGGGGGGGNTRSFLNGGEQDTFGGTGGGLTGGNGGGAGTSPAPGSGGTPTAHGSGGGNGAGDGVFGAGGAATCSGIACGGGGGGWWGGGGAGGGGGGGGSGHGPNGVTFHSGVRSGNGLITVTYTAPPDANLSITPATATDSVGANHVLTITVNSTNGGELASGTATASIVGGTTGSFVGSPTCSYTGGAATASCTVTITSTLNGTTQARATSTIGFTNATGTVTRTTDGTHGSSGPAAVTWLQLTQTIAFTSTPPSPALVGGSYTPTATGGGSGNPVMFTIDASSAAGACSLSGGTVSFTGPGVCVLDANQAGNVSYLPAVQKQQSFTIGFSATITGTVSGSLTVSAGQVVFLAPGATVDGSVTVQSGGILWAQGATIQGAVSAAGAAGIHLCASSLSARLTVTGSTGPVVVGDDDGPTSCAGNSIGGLASITGNTAGVEFDHNTVQGSLTITGNTGTLPPPDSGAVDAVGNTVSGKVTIQP
jgi:Glycine rich protein